MSGRQTRATIVQVAATVMRAKGFHGMGFRAVARHADIPLGTIQHHFRTLAQLQSAVVEFAVVTEDLAILGHALLVHDPAVKTLPAALRQRVAQHVANR